MNYQFKWGMFLRMLWIINFNLDTSLTVVDVYFIDFLLFFEMVNITYVENQH